MKIAFKGSNILTIGGRTLTPVETPVPPPPEPVVLPNYTIRVKYKTGTYPNSDKIASGGVINLVDEANNIWDVVMRKEVSPGHYLIVRDWSALFMDQTNLLEVIGANTYRITLLTSFVRGCTSLTSFALIDTSGVTEMTSMFMNCTSLTSVPLLDTTSCTNMDAMFMYCSNVESGALALYQQASSQANVPSHQYTFYECGSNTVTGAAELAQIPDGWKVE